MSKMFKRGVVIAVILSLIFTISLVSVSASSGNCDNLWCYISSLFSGKSLTGNVITGIQSSCPAEMQGYWKGEGDATDALGKNSGVLVNGLFAPGKVGQAFRLDANNSQHVEIPNSDSLNMLNGKISLEAWVNWNGNHASDSDFNLFQKGTYGEGPGTSYLVQLRPSQGYTDFDYSIENSPNVNGQVIRFPWNLPANQWVHLVFTFDYNTKQAFLYANNQKIAFNQLWYWCGAWCTGWIPSNNPPRADTYPLKIGGGFYSTDDPSHLNPWYSYFPGLIDEAAVYNRVLTDAEVAEHYNNGNTNHQAYCTTQAQPVVETCGTGSTQNLVRYWKFDEASGTSAADIISGDTGTLNNGPTFVPGKVNNSLKFYGSQWVEDSMGGGFGGGDEVTVESWVYFDEWTPIHNNCLFSWAYQSGNLYATYLDPGSGATNLQFELRDSNWGADVVYNGNGCAPVLQTGQWYHMAVTRKRGDQIKLYVNGSPLCNATASNLPLHSTTGKFIIGDYPPNPTNYGINGKMDEVAIYNRALSASEVQQHYINGMAGQPYCEAAPPQPVVQTCGVNSTQGMISYWKGEGNANDTLGISSGTFHGNVDAAAPGKVGTAFEFHGNDYITFGSAMHSLDYLQPYTVTFWKYTISSTSYDNFIMDKGNPYANNFWFIEEAGGNLNWGFISPGNNVYWIISAPAYNQWHHVTLVMNTTGIQGYVDGQAVPTRKAVLAPGDQPHVVTDWDFYMGAGITENWFYNGRLDEIAFFNRSLNASEVQNLYAFSSIGNGYCTAPDADSDGIADILDNCPTLANPGQEDTDGSGIGDACNDATDPDGDDYENSYDNCPTLANPGQEDTDGSGIGDACNDAIDPDNDEFDILDNCPAVANTGQEDSEVSSATVYKTLENQDNLPGGSISGGAPIYGNNVQFSCGSCDVATFDDAVNYIGGGYSLCGYGGQVPRQIIQNNNLICARDSLGNKYTLDLVSFAGGEGCFGDCSRSGGYTSYERTSTVYGDGKGDACDCDADGLCTAQQYCLTHGTPDADCVPADTDGDTIPDSTDNCVNDYNPDQLNKDNQNGGDVCDVCPEDATDSCNPVKTGGEYIPQSGGDVTNQDNSLTVTVPASATSGSSFAMQEAMGTDLTVKTGAVQLAAFNVEPSGAVFNQPVTLSAVVSTTALTQKQINSITFYMRRDDGTWTSYPTTRTEILGDGIGDNDGICEPNEKCTAQTSVTHFSVYALGFISDNIVSVQSAEAYTGEQVVVPIILKNNEEVAGMQFYLSYPDDVVLSSIQTTSRTSSGATIINNSVPGNLKLASLFYPNIAIGNGDVLNLVFEVGSNAAAGVYPLELSNVVVGNSMAENMPVSLSSGTLTILQACVDNDGDGYGIEGYTNGCTYSEADCDDNDASINPGAEEICDGIDNNCDTQIDEGFDNDGDGIADCFDNCADVYNPGQEDTDNNLELLHSARVGYARNSGQNDLLFDESLGGYMVSGHLHPGDKLKWTTGNYAGIMFNVLGQPNWGQLQGFDVTASSGIDYIVNGWGYEHYRPLPGGDGIGDACDCGSDGFCTAEQYCIDQGTPDPDCCQGTDSDNDQYTTSADDVGKQCCNGETCIDLDCDDSVASCNNDCDYTYYEDADDDSYGNPYVSARACDAPSNYVDDNSDCDDSVASCNTDCDSINYLDADQDGYGIDDSARACDAPDYYTSDNTDDCNDNDDTTYPGASDNVCDGTDHNCNGIVNDEFVGAPVTVDNYIDTTWKNSDQTITLSANPACEFVPITGTKYCVALAGENVLISGTASGASNYGSRGTIIHSPEIISYVNSGGNRQLGPGYKFIWTSGDYAGQSFDIFDYNSFYNYNGWGARTKMPWPSVSVAGWTFKIAKPSSGCTPNILGNEITINQDGNWIVSYESTDSNGNTEDANSINVKLDKTNPTAPSLNSLPQWSTTGDVSLSWTASNADVSGLDRYEVWRKGGSVQSQQCPSETVSYWKFDENSGTTAGDTADSNPGIINGATWTTGKVGTSALSFDGSNDYINVPDANNLDITTAGTFEAWIKRNSNDNAHYIIIGKDSYASRAFNMHIYNSKLYFEVFGGGTGTGHTGNLIISSGTWHHVAVTYQYTTNGGSVVKFYVDGVLDKTDTNACGPINVITQNLNIGRHNYAGYEYYFNGLIDDVAIYNQVLDGQTIAQHYNNGLGKDYCSQQSNDFEKVSEDLQVLSFTDTGLPTDTTYTYKIKVFDNAGNYAESNEQSITVDTENPSVQVVNPEHDQILSVDSVTVNAEYANTYNVNCQASVDGSVFVDMNGDNQVSGTAYYTFNGLPDGYHDFTVTCVDQAGNSQADYANNVLIDTIAPVTESSFTSADWQTSIVDVDLICSDSGSGCEATYYCVDTFNSCMPSISGSSVQVSNEGTNYIRFYSIDVAGNPESVKSQVVRIDTAAPTITDNYALNGIWTGINQVVTLDPLDSTSGIAGVSYCNGEGCAPSTILMSPYQLSYSTEQNTIVRYQATDIAGLTSLIGTYNVKLDKTNPEVTITASGTEGNAPWYVSTVNWVISATDELSGIKDINYNIQ